LCPHSRRSAIAAAARSNITVQLGSSRSNAPGDSGRQSADVEPTRLAPVGSYASGDDRALQAWS
jgi:hypothetical protein